MGKRAYLLKLLQDIRASYWFLPTVLVFVGLLLAALMSWADRNAAQLPFTLPDTLVDTQADGARSTLAVIAQSVIGVTGVMFSMTLVAVSFASGNFGPRLIGNFMRDRGNQWSLGILISTFVYALVILRTVQDGTDDGIAQYVPQYSVLFALLLTLLCVFTLIYFVHHVPETINVSRITANIGASLEQQLRDMIDGNDGSAAEKTPPTSKPDEVVMSSVAGYIQTVNFDQLKELANDNNLEINMVTSIGDFVTITTPVFEVWAREPLDDELKSKLSACFAVGTSRTENQNPTFLAEQLVEMIARAMSPGVNDPYTAMDCLNRLASALTVASNHETGLLAPKQDMITFPHLTFEKLFAATFPLCHEYIVTDALTRNHAQDLLEALVETVRPSDKRCIRAELDKIKSAS